MSFATEASKISPLPTTSKDLLMKPNVTENENHCRLTRYVHGRKNKNLDYKSFLVNLDDNGALSGLSDNGEDLSAGIFLRVHIPIRHKLLFRRYNMTLEDLKLRLNEMDIKYPLCAVGTYNSPGSRLNYLKALEDRTDGIDYLMLLFVPAGLVNLYKSYWPNQIIVEIPFDKSAQNIRDITRQTIKSFGATLQSEYVFVIEDDVYAAYRSNGTPISLLQYFTELQAVAGEGFPLVGGKSVGLNDEITPGSGYENAGVDGAYMLNTSVDVNFSPVSQSADVDAGLTQYTNDANAIGLVQQNQDLVLRRGYTIYDPVPAGTDETLRRVPKYKDIYSLEPETNNLDLRVTVISNEVAIDKVLPDGTRYIRSLAIVADESASSILIGVGEEQVGLLKPGAILDLRTARVQMFNGFMRIIVNRGLIVPSEDQTPQNINKTENISVIEYELVD
eukprot:TRINITY_DN9189_c0_g1_i1.p1 TRINITY_DN9189_c0_g1~~TRINITY_DN9189_c0_g1_i1.p1  ORF type:complete len:447 (+),score=119.99 TRINITY_DN9189_c0_g1_i1:113-1453(+)